MTSGLLIDSGVLRTPEPGEASQTLELRPHCSLTPKSARVFVASVAAPTLGLAGVFAAQGFWPILPFAGLEIGLLIFAVRVSLRRALVRENIVVTSERVTVSHVEGSTERTSVFPRQWVRVTLHAPLASLHSSRLMLESHGRACEVGRFLTDDERRHLAVRLKQLVGRGNVSPAS